MRILPYQKSLGHTVQNPSLQMQNWAQVTTPHGMAIWWQIQDQKCKPLPLTAVHILLKHNCIHFCYSKEVSAWMTGLAPPKLLWNQVPDYKLTSPQDKVWKTTSEKLEEVLPWCPQAWGNRPLLGYSGSSYNCAFYRETEQSSSLRFCEV